MGNTDLRVLTTGAEVTRGALQVARPLDEVDSVALRENKLVIADRRGDRRHRAGRAARRGRRARGARARSPGSPRAPRRSPRDPDITQRLEVVEATTSSPRLARSFNTTLDALEASLESQRNLVANASHELRTPISTIRANIQLLREEADRLSR